ncbi:hypothetical protein TWF481_006137 [Arthrobotrys musiformis]|uniref:Uncharacterized protein n=1 Tax=Arthrobotrys musiformis TaxID=47236 RepID=A0AAV9WHU6_9PEZI
MHIPHPPFILLLPLTTAYFTVFLRSIGPEWFMSFNYFLTGTNLHPRSPSPTSCHEVALSHHKDAVTALGIYNPPDETPIEALAVYPYKTPSCGRLTRKGAAIMSAPPTFVVLLGERAEGLFVVDVKKLGIEWYRGSMQPLNITAERIDARGLLYNLPKHESGVYIWQSTDSSYKTPDRRVFIPNAVHKIPQPDTFLQQLDLPAERVGYVYMRDLMERYLRPDMVGTEDTVSPWIREYLEGKYEKFRPPLSGPLYEKDGEVRGGWFTKDDGTQFRRSNVEARKSNVEARKGERKNEKGKDKRGWTLAYKGPDEGEFPGMEYYDLKMPVRLDGEFEGVGGQDENEMVEEDAVYVHISDDEEEGVSEPLHRMQRVRDDPALDYDPDTILIKKEDIDWDEGVSSNYELEEEKEQEESIASESDASDLRPDADFLQQNIPPDILPDPSAQDPIEEELKQEEIVAAEIPSTMAMSTEPASDPLSNPQPPNVLREELRALIGPQLPNLNDPTTALRAQEVQMLNQNGMMTNLNPFWYSSTSVRNRDGVNVVDRDRMPDIDNEPLFAASTSSRWRNRRIQEEGGRPSRSLEDYEEYEDPQGRNPRPRGRDIP